MVAIAALRVDDKGFINELVKRIKPKDLSKDDLYRLSLSFIIYIR
jgi:hypothetical protein